METYKEIGNNNKPVLDRIRNDEQTEELIPVCLCDLSLRKYLLAETPDGLIEIGADINEA